MRETIIHSLALDLDEVTFYPMHIYPGTQVYAEALKEGIVQQGLAPYLDSKEFPLYATKTLPGSYLIELAS